MTCSRTDTGSLNTSSRTGSKRTDAQRARNRVHQVPRIDVLGLTPATNQRLALAGLQVQHCHLGVGGAACRHDREQHRPATRQDRREEMIQLAVCDIWRRENRWLPAGGGYAQQTAARVVGRECNRVVGAPACAPGSPR